MKTNKQREKASIVRVTMERIKANGRRIKKSILKAYIELIARAYLPPKVYRLRGVATSRGSHDACMQL